MANDDLREQIAALCHEQWSGWMGFQFKVMRKNDDGLWEIPLNKGLRWQRQMHTRYAELSEPEKDSDREQADRVLALMAKYREEHV